MATQRSTRRGFLQTTAALAAGVGLGGAGAGRSLAEQADAVPAKATAREDTRAPRDPNQPFSISLAEWSLHKALFAKKVDHLDFAKIAKRDFGIDAVEYVNQFFMDKAKDQKYLAEFKQRADDHGVGIKLIMCDDEGELGHANEKERLKAVENHYKWAEAAKLFGCHSIRVNAYSSGTPDEQRDLRGR